MGIDTVRRAVFFDRDGVLNVSRLHAGKPHPPAHAGEVQMHEGASESVARVVQAGFVPVIVTNQPDVARGTVTAQSVEAINREVAGRTGITAVYTCYHDDGDGCNCRKPGAGLLLRAASELGLDLSRSYMIGDRHKDVLAGRNAGCATVFIDWQYPETPPDVGADARASSLGEAVEYILERERCAAS